MAETLKCKKCPACGRTREEAEAAANGITAGDNTADEKLDNDDKTIADYTEAIRRNPNDSEAYKRRGKAYYKDYSNARADLVSVDDPDTLNFSEVRRELNVLLDKAIADYTEAIIRNPNDSEAYKLRGKAYTVNHDYDKAIADYTEAIRINPNDSEAYKKRGKAYTVNHDYDKAIADYTETIRINPNDSEAYKQRENVTLSKTIAVYTETVRRNPKDGKAKQQLENAIFEKMKKLIAEMLEIDEEKISMHASFRQDFGADSLDSYELVYAIEEEMGICIPDEKAVEFETVKDVYEFIKSQLI